MIKYNDFLIKIEPSVQTGVYTVSTESTLGGGGNKSSFELPFPIDELENMLDSLGKMVRNTARHLTVADQETKYPIRPDKIGGQLFEALFRNSTREHFMKCYEHVGVNGLRIKLQIDPELAHLASLPWEFLYRYDIRDFLNLSERTPVVRYYNSPRTYTPLTLEPPLRILVVISNPTGYPRLNLTQEQEQIRNKIAGITDIEVEFLERATIEALREHLSKPQPYHVLHYMGHGDFDEQMNKGAIVFEKEDGSGQKVTGDQLKVLLKDEPDLRLVFLNACETAKVARKEGLDPFAGVATALLIQGIPAVVAMQFPISDAAAILFSQQFYRSLAQRNSVDACVAAGRKGICTDMDESLEWGTPVLFIGVRQENIFDIRPKQSTPDIDLQISVSTETTELTLKPGDSKILPVILHNQSSTARNLRLSVEGIPSEWLSSAVTTVYVSPKEYKNVNLTIQPPRSPRTQAHSYPLRIRVENQDKPEQFIETAATLNVTAYRLPQTRRLWWPLLVLVVTLVSGLGMGPFISDVVCPRANVSQTVCNQWAWTAAIVVWLIGIFISFLLWRAVRKRIQ